MSLITVVGVAGTLIGSGGLAFQLNEETAVKIGEASSGVVAVYFALLAVVALIALYWQGCRERKEARGELLDIIRGNQEALRGVAVALADDAAARRELSGVMVEMKMQVHRCGLAQAAFDSRQGHHGG